jgi:peptide/nickel transport system substrate-binding protein
MRTLFSKSIYLSLAIIMLVTLTLVGCNTSSTTSTTSKPSTSVAATATLPPTVTPQYGGVLKIVSGMEPVVFGYPPLLGTSPGSMEIAYPCIETIIGQDSRGSFVPNKLSTAFSLSPDGKIYTFTLRKGVKFHDGTPWDAKAAKWNLEKIRDTKMVAAASVWTSVEIVDDYTVRINISKSTITDVSNLALFAGNMVSPTAVEKNGEEWAKTHPVGTGPFKFKGYTPKQSVVYERFDDYWGGKPYLDEIHFVFITDSMTAAMALQNGEVDIIGASGSIAADLTTKGYKSVQVKTITCQLIPDTKNSSSPFANLKVRQAVEYAINKAAIAKAVGYGYWDALYELCPQECSGYATGLTFRTYNPDMARQLLKEAGYPSGFSTKLILSGSGMADAATALQQNLKEVNITAEVNTLSTAAYNEFATKGWTNGLLVHLTQWSEPYAYPLQRMYASTGVQFFSMSRPAGFDGFIDQALATTDAAQSSQFSQKAVALAFNEMMTIPAWIYASPRFMNSKVHDIGYYTSGNIAVDYTPGKAWKSK